MCHADAPSNPSPAAVTQEVSIGLPGGEALPALLAHPPAEAPGQRPAVLIVHDVYGRSPFYEDLAARLAGAGYHALLPDAFFRQGKLEDQSREAAFARRV